MDHDLKMTGTYALNMVCMGMLTACLEDCSLLSHQHSHLSTRAFAGLLKSLTKTIRAEKGVKIHMIRPAS